MVRSFFWWLSELLIKYGAINYLQCLLHNLFLSMLNFPWHFNLRKIVWEIEISSTSMQKFDYQDL